MKSKSNGVMELGGESSEEQIPHGVCCAQGAHNMLVRDDK
jgi:hypothetical protein